MRFLRIRQIPAAAITVLRPEIERFPVPEHSPNFPPCSAARSFSAAQITWTPVQEKREAFPRLPSPSFPGGRGSGEPEQPAAVFKHVDREFSGKFSPPVLEYGKIKFSTKFMDGSKHLGVFPEQKPHWEYIDEKLAGFVPYSERGMEINRPRVLNLFGYTGGASLVAAEAGAFVTHVDASKPSIDWARKNQSISGLPSNSIRWILDDALKFVRREERRGARYEAIILDPPAFGRGPRGELWKLEKMLPELLASCSNLLSSKPMFVLMTLYSIEASSLMAANMIRQYFSRRIKPVVECGELVLKPSGNGLVLPLSIWAKADF